MSEEHIEPEPRRAWTLMFYFASDNPLAPSIVHQLKALKAAGFHAGANVIAHFDPYTRHTPSHVFEVNVFEKRKRKPDESDVGFVKAKDQSVHALVLDKIWEDDDDGNLVRERVKGLIRDMSRRGKISLPPDDGRRLPVLPKGKDFKRERSPEESLGAFLDFCARQYPADRYMLFILGHGVVVGNDIFLFDANPGDDEGEENVPATPAAAGNGNGAAGTPGEGGGKNGDELDRRRPRNSLSLIELRGLLEGFKKNIGEGGGEFELLSFHSCSMSGAEVAYELQDTAHYMLASQGPAFVGSWPYRQILLRVFKGLDTAAAEQRGPTDAEVKAVILDIFGDVVRNSFDFQLAGYSFDVALCDLTKAGGLKKPIDDLAHALMDGLGGETSKADLDATVPLARELMLLAHWDAQGFWQENYTDLYDFCYRLRRRCGLLFGALQEPESSPKRVAILKACKAVMDLLEKGTQGDDDRLIVRAEFVGDEYQYSHGLSIFFPWSQPDGPFFGKTYGQYRLIKGKETAWADFLDLYFEKTLRATRDEEGEAAAAREKKKAGREENPLVTQAGDVDAVERQALELLQVIGTSVFTAEGQLAKNGIDDRMGPPGKIGSDDRSGADDCGCPNFKNHPSFTGRNRRGQPRKRMGEEPTQPMSYTMADTIF